MTLVADLQALDLSAIVDARATITVSAGGPELTGVLSGGAATTALGGLGHTLDELRAAAEHPATLLDDVLAALPGLDLLPDLDGLDLAGWEAAVREGAALVGDLVAALGGDLGKLSETLLGAAGPELGGALRAVEDHVQVGKAELAELQRLVSGVAGGVPTDGAGFARMALDVLFAGASGDVLGVRAAVSGLLTGAATVSLPTGRTAGLLEAHAAVAVAARGGDAVAIGAALGALGRARDATVVSLEGDGRLLLERLSGLQAPGAMAAITRGSAGLTAARTGILEFLDKLRAEITGARAGVEGLDPAAAHASITAFLDGVEARAEEVLIAPVQEQVDALEAWVRSLFAHLPLRALRAELSQVVTVAVGAIEDADLDAPATALRARLDALEAQLAGLDLGAVVREALAAAEAVITTALDAIGGALAAIGTAVGVLADGARSVVEAVVDVLHTLAGAVEEAKAAIEALPIEEAKQEVVDAIRALRAQAEELLSSAKLPEGVRPLVDQLVAELRGIDLAAALLGPLEPALAKFRVLDELGLPDLLGQVQGVLSNLVPAQIAVELEAQLAGVLDGIRAFSPDGLKALVEHFLDEAATAVEGVDLAPVRAVVHAPFALLLDGFDQLKPSVLLAPVLAAYDELVGSASLPDPVQASQQLLGAAADAAGHLTPPLTDAAARVAPAAERVAAQVPAAVPPGVPRAGDVVRLFGWLPGRLREALAAIGPAARADAVAALHDVVGGLAADLRGLQSAAFGVGARLEGELDALLAPLAAAQATAQLALTARVSAPGVELDLDVDGAMDAIAAAGPGGLRAALAPMSGLLGEHASALAATVAAQGTVIDDAAAALERSPLAVLAADADALLAALDPEPLAAELDGLLDAAVARLPGLIDEVGAELEGVIGRAQQMLSELNPAVLLQRFLTVLDAVRDELDVLNPHGLARELDRIHDAARATLEAYDPAGLVDEVGDGLRAIATAIRAVDVAGFPGAADLPELAAAVARVEAAVPTQALAGAGAALADAGAALTAFDLAGLVADVDALPARVEDAMKAAIVTVQDELVALLGALHYQQTSASASVSASGSVG